jgi:hypothetical protein
VFEDLLEELLEAGGGGVLQDLGRWALLADHALVHEHHVVGHPSGEAHIVGDHEHGHALAGQLAHDVEHVAHQFRVEGASGLVKYDQIGVIIQRARDTDARRILGAELKREEERLVQMKAEYNNGQPDKQGNEIRNFQKYLDRVADMKAAIERKEGDIAALKRELQKYPQ